MFSFSITSKNRLNTCDPRLIDIFNEVIKYWDCTILEGKRCKERQAELVKAGKSQTMKSKHLDGLAVDVAPYPINWKDREEFSYFAGFVKGIAIMKGISLRWGGDWDNDNDVSDNNFDDLVHFEIREI